MVWTLIDHGKLANQIARLAAIVVKTVLFTCENIDITNQSVDTLFFTSEKNRMTNQLASLARRDYFYLDAFWRVNLGMYIINRGYYTGARRYEFYFRVAKQYFTNERSE